MTFVKIFNMNSPIFLYFCCKLIENLHLLPILIVNFKKLSQSKYLSWRESNALMKYLKCVLCGWLCECVWKPYLPPTLSNDLCAKKKLCAAVFRSFHGIGRKEAVGQGAGTVHFVSQYMYYYGHKNVTTLRRVDQALSSTSR